MEFTTADLLVPLDAPLEWRRKWDRQVKPPPTNTYIGQLKLLATEIAFLTLGTGFALDNYAVVYAGAAAGQHIPALASMFPQLKFFLYDPAPFAIEETEQLNIIKDIFTDEEARAWGAQTEYAGVLFICDIRTSGDSAEEHEAEIESNMAMQAHWVDLLKPALRGYSLKFRIPFPIIEADLPFAYLGGRLIYQPYPKPFSMELRLVGGPDDTELRPYNSRALEEAVFYHNTVIRPDRQRYANIFSGTTAPYRDRQFDNGYDCTYFLHCVKMYVEMYRKTTATEDYTLRLAARLITMTSQGKWTLMQRKAPSAAPKQRRTW